MSKALKLRVRAASAAMPGFIKPQLATLKSKAPVGDQWLNEIKYDGYRVEVHIGPKRRVFTRNGLDWTKRFSTIVGAFDIPGQAIIDGEVVVVHEGRTNFSELQAELAAGRQGRLEYYAFDLLWLNGEDLRSHTQLERKRALERLFKIHKLEAPSVYSEHLVGDGQKMFQHAAKLDWEGIVSKRADAPYRSDRNENWVKVKTVQKGKFPVIGFIKDPTGVAALYLGKREGKDLVYMDKVGTVGRGQSQARLENSSIRW